MRDAVPHRATRYAIRIYIQMEYCFMGAGGVSCLWLMRRKVAGSRLTGASWWVFLIAGTGYSGSLFYNSWYFRSYKNITRRAERLQNWKIGFSKFLNHGCLRKNWGDSSAAHTEVLWNWNLPGTLCAARKCEMGVRSCPVKDNFSRAFLAAHSPGNDNFKV